jgi:(2Fe-2S) ferredoxin
MPILNPILTNIRDGVKFIRVTSNQKEKFVDIVTQKGISCERSLSLDVPTRWNSTFTIK